ncbi:MAG: RNA polymerase factor sigma-54 [Clostridiaceae bacterium]
MEYNLNLSQEQKLIMTQEMQLSVKILQMTAFELQEYIENELEENPILEDKGEMFNTELKDKLDFTEIAKQLEYNPSGPKEYSRDNEQVSPFNFISESKSLKEYLFEQVSDLSESDICKSICNYIVENLDSKGYLDVSSDIIARELRIENEMADHALKLVQSLDPAGIAARDLKECLKIQVDRKGLGNENIYRIIDEHLELLAENKFNIIARELKIDVLKAQEYGDIIRSLQPKPSSGFYTGEQVKYIIPDAYIKRIDTEYYIIMNDELGPKLTISSLYQKILKSGSDKETIEYIKNKLNNAVFLIKSIEHRKTTIYKVLEKIIEIQKEYFDLGKEHLRPMTLREIADSLEIHESTVSRAIRDKYILTDRGTIKIKDLFTTGISSSSGGEDVSTNIIKNEIAKLIEGEDKKIPLSDQHIADILLKSGMNISRRTVAKYREEMGIKSSKGRKRF